MALVLKNGQGEGSNGIVDETEIDHSLLELCLTSTKGLGLFAKQDIKAGTRLIAEIPLVVLPSKQDISYRDLQQKLDRLNTAQHDAFHSLSSGVDSPRRSQIASVKEGVLALKKPLRDDAQLNLEARKLMISETNATPMHSNSQYGIFLLYSRINHDCTPNAYASYNPTIGSHNVHAMRDIGINEEVLVSYIDPAESLQTRDQCLTELHVDCWCSNCSPGKTRHISEKRRSQIVQIRRGLQIYDGDDGDASIRHEPVDVVPDKLGLALAMAETAIQLMRDEKLLGMGLAKLYRQASKYSLQLGSVDKARSHARKEAEIERICLGAETDYMNETERGPGSGNAAAWMRQVERIVEKDQVKIRLCEKRELKDKKKADKKAQKKAAKGGGR